MKPLIVYELKREVSSYLATINVKNLAQTLVEGYYVLMGTELTSVIVALTDVAVTHYFKIKLHSTSNTEMLEVEWHKPFTMQHYPPTSIDDVANFVGVVHELLDSCTL